MSDTENIGTPNGMDAKFLKPYNPQETESALYEKWHASGYFSPERCVENGVTKDDAKPYSIVLPPPNVTGVLHIGHAAMLAVEDILVRHHRMLGDKTLWIPGTDHAAIATQTKVEKLLQKEEGKNRHDLGREEFLQRVRVFAQDSHDTIVTQVRAMGSSLDWDREAFTLDEVRERAVVEAFKRLYDLGLIYQGHRIVNWDPKGQTTISDDEIVYEEEKTTFYYFKYGPFVIGTARPETKFGDKYVVMHPNDKRYTQYKHGEKLALEWINGPVTATIIKDEAIDMEFGTGVMTITPWHSVIDFEIAERHGLDKEQIIDTYGKLLPIAGEFAGMKIADARVKVVETLEKKGLLVKKEENYVHNIARAERSNGFIEPQIMKQWFIAVNKPFVLPESHIPGIKAGSTVTLKEMMLRVVRDGNIAITPERFEKIYFHWIENLHDWCISRQIWYGHRVPVWYKENEVHVGAKSPGDGWKQDEDTLDTWFSSGLWTFSTLGWPNDTEDMRQYHPTSVLETGYDILFFWVAKMILMSTALVGDVPFKHVYLHGLVRDEKGRKMSKSLGNTIDPIDLIQKYGADATRLALIIGAAAGNDIKLSEQRVKGYKNFTNKVWNVTRFVLQSMDDVAYDADAKLHEDDVQLQNELQMLAQDVTDDIAAFRLYLAAEKLYHFLWHRFADVIIEESKPIFQGSDNERKSSRMKVLYTMLVTQLKLLHPFTPFVTEEIWSALPVKDSDFVMVSKWPV